DSLREWRTNEDSWRPVAGYGDAGRSVGAGVEVCGDGVGTAFVGGVDLQGGAAAAGVVRVVIDLGVGDLGVAGGERGGAAEEAGVGEAGEQVADAVDLVVGWAEVLLVVPGEADGPGALFVGESGERDQVEELVDQL